MMQSFVLLLFVFSFHCVIPTTNAQQQEQQQTQQQTPSDHDHNHVQLRRSNNNEPAQELVNHHITPVKSSSYPSTVSRNDDISNEVNENEADSRDLQIDIGTVLDVVNLACDLVGNLMLLDGTAVCDCTLTLSLEFGCNFVSEVCVQNFCSTPNVTGAFDILQTRVTFDYCANDGTFNSAFDIPDFCVAVSGNLVRPGASSSSSSISNEEEDEESATTNNNSDEPSDTKDRPRLFGEGNILDKVQFLDTIRVTVGDKECRSASICNNGQGYIFDCTNIDKRLKQSTCTSIQTITNLRQEPGSIVFLPQLDNPPTPIPMPSVSSIFALMFQNFTSVLQLLQHHP